MNSIEFGNNRYCGPSVMSAILGITTDEAEAVIQSVTGQKRNVTAVYENDLRKAFESLNYKTEAIEASSNTVFGCLFRMRLSQSGMFVFTVPGHFIAIEINGGHMYICDNHSKEPIRAVNSARLSQKVVKIFKVIK